MSKLDVTILFSISTTPLLDFIFDARIGAKMVVFGLVTPLDHPPDHP